MNEAIEEVDFLIQLSEKEKSKAITHQDSKNLYFFILDKANYFITQLAAEDAPGFNENSLNKIQSYKAEITNKYHQNSLKITTLFLLGIKLAFLADDCRIDMEKATAAKLFFPKQAQPRLRYLFSSKINQKQAAQLQKYAYIADLSFDELERQMSDIPIIPLISEDPEFGIMTFLYSASKGYLIVGVPINNQSSAHGGITTSYKKFLNYMDDKNKIDRTVLLDLNFSSSIMGFEHDLDHVQRMIKIFDENNNYRMNPEVKTVYKKVFEILQNKWTAMEHPSAAALFIFWLFHENGYHHAGYTISPIQLCTKLLSEKSRRELEFLCSIPSEKAFKKKIIDNEFDFAHYLNRLGYNIDINEEEPCRTIEATRDIFLRAIAGVPEITEILEPPLYKNLTHLLKLLSANKGNALGNPPILSGMPK